MYMKKSIKDFKAMSDSLSVVSLHWFLIILFYFGFGYGYTW